MEKIKICPVCGCINLKKALLCENCTSRFSKEKIYDDSEIDIVELKICPQCRTKNDKVNVICSNCSESIDGVKPKKIVKKMQMIFCENPEKQLKDSKENVTDKIIYDSLENVKNVLVFVTQNNNRIEIKFKKKVILGREGDINPEIFSPYPTVSRKHLIAKFVNDQWFISDNKSTNGTYLNGEKIKMDKQYPIKVGDTINLSTKFKLKVEKA